MRAVTFVAPAASPDALGDLCFEEAGGRMIEAIYTAAAFIGTHAVSLGLGAGAAILGTAGVSYLIVRLPEDYLDRPESPLVGPDRPAWMRGSVKVGKNVLGAAMIVAGGGVTLTGHPVMGPFAMLVG